jgi:ribonucleoside-diphosphate reductase alpha chain
LAAQSSALVAIFGRLSDVSENIVDAVIAARYLNKGERCWEDVCMRVATFVGNDDYQVKAFYDLILNAKFLPNSPTLMNAGTPIGQLSACFVLPVEDDMTGIFDAVKWTAMIHKSGGGTGFNFSKLRAEGSIVGSTNGVASGPISFMKVFNEATETVKQGGKRRGANMGILNCTHPDVKKFIVSKKTEGQLANFNFSVMVTDDFMEKVLDMGYTGEEKEIFELMIDNQWNNGEPSFLFHGNINKKPLTPSLGPIDATNPCGEQPLYPFESCNLGSIDLSKFVDDSGQFDYSSLQDTVVLAVQFLDNIIDKNNFPLPQIEKATKRTRKIGLGVMGFHDALIKMGVPYDSKRAVEIANSIMENIQTVALDASEQLGAEYGLAPYYEQYPDSIDDRRRNVALTCIAPTGSISILAKCWSGIEPAIWVMQRCNTVGKSFFVVHPLFEKMLREEADERGIDEAGIQKAITDVHASGSIEVIDWLPKKIKRLYKSAFDLTWKQHLDIVVAFQKHCDAAVSKTVNMPATSTKQDFKDAVVYAWKNGLKGVTLYRTGSRQDEVLTLAKEVKPAPTPKLADTYKRMPFFDHETQEWRWLPKRPDILPTYGLKKMRSGCGDLLIDISELNGRPYDCLGDYTLGGGGCDAMLRTTRVLLGLCFRWGVPTWDIVKNLKAIKCDVAREKYKRGEADGISCANCIGRYIEENIPDDMEEVAYPFKNGNKEQFLRENGLIMDSLPTEKSARIIAIDPAINNGCPECGSEIMMEEGCRKCHACGWSQC